VKRMVKVLMASGLMAALIAVYAFPTLAQDAFFFEDAAEVVVECEEIFFDDDGDARCLVDAGLVDAAEVVVECEEIFFDDDSDARCLVDASLREDLLFEDAVDADLDESLEPF
jgi:hypothetical protein